MELNFNFLKKRNFGDLIQDYFTLVRKIFAHFTTTILTLSSIFIAIFLVLVFYASGKFIEMAMDPDNFAANPLFIISNFFLIIVLFFTLFNVVYGVTVEYTILLKEKGSTDFNYKDVLRSFKQNFFTYVKAFFVGAIALLIISIPLVLIFTVFSFVFLLLPFIGIVIMQLASTLISVIIGVYFYCAILLYREKRYGLVDSFVKSFSFVNIRIFEQGLASFIIQMIISTILGIITIVLMVIAGIVFYTTTGMDYESFLLSFSGKLIIAVLSSIFLVIIVLSSIFPLLFMTLIYYTNVEYNFNESSLSDIDEIGDTKDVF